MLRGVAYSLAGCVAVGCSSVTDPTPHIVSAHIDRVYLSPSELGAWPVTPDIRSSGDGIEVRGLTLLGCAGAPQLAAAMHHAMIAVEITRAPGIYNCPEAGYEQRLSPYRALVRVSHTGEYRVSVRARSVSSDLRASAVVRVLP